MFTSHSSIQNHFTVSMCLVNVGVSVAQQFREIGSQPQQHLRQPHKVSPSSARANDDHHTATICSHVIEMSIRVWFGVTAAGTLADRSARQLPTSPRKVHFSRNSGTLQARLTRFRVMQYVQCNIVFLQHHDAHRRRIAVHN